MKTESVKKNFIYQVAYQVLIILIPMVTAPYISRTIGANGVGIYSYTYSIASYFALVAKLGIEVYGNRAIAAVRDDKEKLNQTFSDLLFIHVFFAFLVVLFYIGYAFVYPSEYTNIVFIQILYVIGEMIEVDWLFFGLEKFRVTVTRNSIIKLLTLVAIFLFVKDSNDVWVYCAIMAAGTALSQTAVWIFVPSCVKFVKPNFKDAFSHLKPLITFFIPSIAVSLYKVMDKIMLGAMSSTVEVGFYENSEKIVTMVLGLVTALGTVMMPRMTNLAAKGNEEQSKKIINTSINFIMILTLAMAFGIVGVSKVFMPVFFGDEFASCYILVMIIAISMPFCAFANVLRTQFLIPNNHDRIYQGSVISGAVLNLIVNATLIPFLGAQGAAIGTVVAEGSVCVIQGFFSRKWLPIWRYIRNAIPYLVYGIIMAIAVYGIGMLMGISFMTLVVQVLVGVIIYGVLALLHLWRSHDEIWNMAIQMLSSGMRKLKKKQ